MPRTLKTDKLLFVATFLLVCAGVVMVYSASAALAVEKFGQPYLFLVKQATFLLAGLLALAVLMRVDYHSYQQPSVIWTALAVVGVSLVFVLFAVPVKNTHRWFQVAGLTFQPSEFAKLAMILFTADRLARRFSRIDELQHTVLPVGIILCPTVALIMLQPDFGTGFMVVVIAAVMFYAAGLSYRYAVLLGGVLVPLLIVVLMVEPYRIVRIIGWIWAWDDPEGAGFHIVQSQIAVGTGGLLGRGLMAGIQKLHYLPEPHTDFIYAVVAEELGMIGATAMVVAYLVIMWRGLRVTLTAPDQFGALLALGITTMIAFQALVNISVVLGLFPTKGLPLPFVSAGGSSLLVSLLAMGMLLNVSQHSAGH